ncbi:helix-turn-helix transcriptional regulator [Streptomyces sp. NPDC049910]|uniref:helix-turn-helix transcriptional regulator n=1 Tax=Streptomyces sp. NPDC049910 TaxID=3155278 RepID=UPI003422AF44
MSIEGAEAADLSAGMVIGIEHGKRNPPLPTILAPAQGLGVTPGRLLESRRRGRSLGHESTPARARTRSLSG